MTDTPNSPLPPEEGQKKGSLLDAILHASHKHTPAEKGTVEEKKSDVSGSPDEKKEEAPKPKKEPISMGVFLRLIGSLLFVSIIFFGSFLAYIAFNPAQAVFFVTTFNIDPSDIQNLLKKLINASFGFIMIIVSITWVITLFKAFWVPKELKRKRLLSWLMASMTGLILFLILAFWGILFRYVGAADYTNPNGAILIYDQNLYSRDEYKDISRITRTSNVIGPIDIFFDIRKNAQLIEKETLSRIDSFEINFDGATCDENGGSVISGTSPESEQSIVCTFDEIKNYNIVGSYEYTNRTGEKKSMPIVLPNIEVRGLVDVRSQANNQGKDIITLDATSLTKLGSPRWVYQSGKEVTEPSVTEIVSPVPQGVCLKLYESDQCDRIFILENTQNKTVAGSILILQDTTNKSAYRFSLSGITLNENEITEIEWLLDKQNVICSRDEDVCNYSFSTYGRKNIQATVKTANGEKYSFEADFNVNEPLTIIRRVKVMNSIGTVVNPDSTYDSSLRAFVLRNTIVPPETLTFDARDVVSNNPGFVIESVLWKISNGKTVEEKRGDKIDIEFNQPLRYNIEIFYTFSKEVPGEKNIEETSKEMVIIDIERRSLMPRMDISLTSDYIPALATVDASQSETENGEIKKFIFDFGEGKVPAEGDAIRQYQYNTPGEKTITLTVIAENGEKASLKKTIVIKDQVKTIDFSPSIQPGILGNMVDFEAVGTTGQVEDYVWNFGDNSPAGRGYIVSHMYSNAGTYDVTLTIIYSDGTQQTKKKKFEVANE